MVTYMDIDAVASRCECLARIEVVDKMLDIIYVSKSAGKDRAWLAHLSTASYRKVGPLNWLGCWVHNGSDKIAKMLL